MPTNSKLLRKGGRRTIPASFNFCPPTHNFNPLGSTSIFGDGLYSQNIIQGGSVLQPQTYLLAGVGVLSDCIVVTGTATVAPDLFTGAAVFTCKNLVLVGGSASLTSSTNCKGLWGFVSGSITTSGGARLRMDSNGKAGDFGATPVPAILPDSVLCRVSRTKLSAFVLSSKGANGSTQGAAAAPAAAGQMQTGGGGSGGSAYGAPGCGKAGFGGPFCGGAGCGGGQNTSTWQYPVGDYGGPGGNSFGYGTSGSGGGGSGDPPGLGYNGGNPGTGRGGGIIGLFTPLFTNGSGCIVSADGTAGGSSGNIGGGGSGGGCVLIVTKPGGYINNGTVRAIGGLGGSAPCPGVAGGLGSINLLAA